jgi:hypothetical protein
MEGPAPRYCPLCAADFRGDPIPEKDREFFSPPYYFLRVITVTFNDRFDHYKCPDCGYEWRDNL